MSVLRLLTPAFIAHPSPTPTLTLHVPAYGVLYLTRPSQSTASSSWAESSTSNTLRGELEINVPSGNRKRCRSIKVGLKTCCRLLMGEKWEEDVIFERDSVHQAGNGEGIWLEEGVTKYEFTFELPQTLATHDWHPEGTIRHDLYAEIEGIPSSHFSFFHRAQSPAGGKRSKSRSRHQSPAASRHISPNSTRPASRAQSPARGENSFLSSATMSEPPSISLIQQVNTLPPVPTYDQSEYDVSHPHHEVHDEHDGTWLEGTFKVVRAVKLCYNPHPTGGINSLEERSVGEAPGLGGYELMLRAPVWTVGSLLSCSFKFNNLPPTCTIFEFRINLIQTIHITSPRNPSSTPKETHHIFPILKIGKRPNPDLHRPPKEYKSLFRGTTAHGHDEKTWGYEGKGRMPRDREARPSTCEGLITPLRVTHQLGVEVVFSIWGEDAFGQSIKGPGDQRRLRIVRGVVLPACPILPQVFSLPACEFSLSLYLALQYSISDPSYFKIIPANPFTVPSNRSVKAEFRYFKLTPDPTHPMDKYASPNTPCPLCHTRIEDKVCTSCPATIPTHVRHDMDKKLVGNKEGVCRLCAESLFPAGEVGRRNCSCGLSDEDFEVLAKGDREAQVLLATREGGDGGGGGSRHKEEEEERGRERSRRV